MTWVEAFVRRWWPLLAAGAAIAVAAVAVPSLTGENESERCLTTHGRRLCGDQAKTWCRITSPIAALAGGFNPSRADLEQLRRFAPDQARALERQAAESRAKLARYDEVCAAFK